MACTVRMTSASLAWLMSFFCVVFLIGIASSETQKLSEDQSLILKHAVKQMLGFKDLPPVETPKHTKSRYKSPKPPKYMLDLYEQYKFSTFPKGGQRGNTVRMIYGDMGTVNRHHMFIFNLSSVFATEKVISAEIHLYKRKIKFTPKSDMNLIMFDVTKMSLNTLGDLYISSSSIGWQAYDITRAFQMCLDKNRKKQHLFGIIFRTGSAPGSNIPLKKFVRHHSKPFLIIYSNDTQNLTIDHIEPYFQPRDRVKLEKHLRRIGYQGDVEGEELEEPIQGRRAGHRGRPESPAKEVDAGTAKPNEPKPTSQPKHTGEDGIVNDEATTRRRRSVLDNEIPEDPRDHFDPKSDYNIPDTNPGILRGRQRGRQRSDPTEDPQLIPYPVTYKQNNGGRRRNKNRNQERHRNSNRNKSTTPNRPPQSLPFPRDWKQRHDNDATFSERRELCARRELQVDFADIGWGEWIISPKSFEAQYCAGRCPFPLTKGMKPTNHATIQSIVHAIGIKSKVPAPCCVPDVMSSVTLLYFDENRNVVLKNYPGMSVQSCACR